jgi:SAM-dependent methyltransferase
MAQRKQNEWAWQWSQVADIEEENVAWLREWLAPYPPESFHGETVLEAGCGSGLHTRYLAPHCKRLVAVDLNAAETARRNTAHANNVEIREDDIATMNFSEPFDTVFSFGVVHHTDDPDRTVANLKRLLRPGGRLLIRVYAREGNLLMRRIVEPLRRRVLADWSRARLLLAARCGTVGMWLAMHTVYRLPLSFLPYYRYLRDSRALSFTSNVLNVFDKLNAPQTQFVPREQVDRWFDHKQFEDVQIDLHHGTTWRASGRKRSVSDTVTRH